MRAMNAEEDETRTVAQPAELLRIENLTTAFRGRDKVWRPVIRDVSLSLKRGETLGIVGESGSGKSVTMSSMLGLAGYKGGRVQSGKAIFDGTDLLTMDTRDLRDIRGSRIGVVFQDPMTSLNPVRSIGRQMIETIQRHTTLRNDAARARAEDLLRSVRIPDVKRQLKAYPHQLSGGMRQRVMIAIALSCEPELIIADEPTTALDVTVQLDVLDLLRQRTKENGVAVIVISHDLGVIGSLADRIAVMYAGRVVETGTTRNILSNPKHPYSVALQKSIPTARTSNAERLYAIPGVPPSAATIPSGCSFRDRCEFAQERCAAERPLLRTMDGTVPGGHLAACHFPIGKELPIVKMCDSDG